MILIYLLPVKMLLVRKIGRKMTNTTNSALTLKKNSILLFFSGSHADPPAPEKI